MLESLKKKIWDYFDKRIQLHQYNLSEKLIVYALKFLFFFLILLFAFFALFFVNVALAVLINISLKSAYLGYFIIALFYIIVLGLLWLSRHNKFWKILADKIVNKIR